MSKDFFLYQINFNRKKFPEICQALEDAKADLGVAWYLRELISKDIEEKKRNHSKEETNIELVHEKVIVEEQKVKKEINNFTSSDLPDDTGGFL